VICFSAADHYLLKLVQDATSPPTAPASIPLRIFASLVPCVSLIVVNLFQQEKIVQGTKTAPSAWVSKKNFAS
jgi:hypothetical protein